jgi:membrane protein required for colicin V production
MNNLPVIDLIFLILIILMVIHGYVRGFIEEIFSWATLVLAIWAAVFLYPAGAEVIRKKIMQDVRLVPEILAFIAIFILIMIFLKMLEHILKDVITGAKLGGVNKVLGAVFGLIEGFALTALVLFVLDVQPLFNSSKVIGDSIFAQILMPFIKAPLNQEKDMVNTVLLMLPNIPLPRFPA